MRRLARGRLSASEIGDRWREAIPLVPLAVTFVILLPLTPAYDLDAFLRAGHAVLNGQPVYPHVGSPDVYSGSAFVYPYFMVLPFALLALLPRGVATVVFFSVSATAVLAACRVAAGPGFRPLAEPDPGPLAEPDRRAVAGPDRRPAGRDPWPAVLVLGSAFTITGLQLGSVSPLLFAGAMFLWKLRDRPVPFALLAGPVVASKLFLLPLLAWPLLAHRRRAFAYAASSTVALLVAGFALGPVGPVAYLRMLSQLGSHEARTGFGLAGVLLNSGVAPATARVSAIAAAAIVLAVAYLDYVGRRDERVLFAAGLIAGLLASPVVWSHYLILLAAPLLVMRLPARWLFVAALASWAIAPPHGQHLDTDVIDGVASSSIWLLVVAAALAAGCLSYGRREDRLPAG